VSARVRTVLRRLLVAVAFLTRLPVPPGREVDEVDVGRSAAFFPLVGLVLGAVLVVVAALLARHLPSSVLSVLLVALLAALTGALHLDGVADTFDALGSPSADRARRLEILRDSRIGAHGATALVLVVLLKLTALHAVLASGAVAAVLLFPALARCVATIALVRFPYARVQGLGAAFAAHGSPRDALAVSAATLVATWLLGGGPAVLAALVASGVVLLFVRRVAGRLGGVTGDVCGAAIELAEAAFLVLYLAAS